MSNALTIGALVGVAVLVWVLYLYRRKRLKEDHALLWLLVSIGIILLSTWTDLLLAINVVVGASRTTDVVLAAFVAFLILVSIYYSMKISELTDQNRRIAQELALMRGVEAKPTSSTALSKRED